jgi:DNA (cytosine-5)-methyltransferase 1
MKRLLDLFCGAGGAATGYHRAGFDVIGVDIKEQPNYPFEFIESDVFDLDPDFIKEFDIIHASPPCQAYSRCRANAKAKNYPDLLGKTRELLIRTDIDYVIENVVGAKMQRTVLCGTMFALNVIRHRYFESSIWIYPPGPCRHNGFAYDGNYACVISGDGYGSNTDRDYFNMYAQSEKKKIEPYLVKTSGKIGAAKFLYWCDSMGIHWMNKHQTLAKNKYDLTQAVPPAYTQYIGGLLLQ